MDLIEKLEEEVKVLRAEGEKFYNKGIKASGTRLRKSAQTIKTISQEIRNNVTETRNKEA
jgi:hypothetical protein